MKYKGLLLVIVALFVLSVNSVYAYSSIYGDVYGTVTDNYGIAVKDAKVEITLLNIYAYTNINGTYKLENITSGTYELKASKTGYQTVQMQIQITSNQALQKDIILTKTTNAIDIWDLANKIVNFSWYGFTASIIIVVILVLLALYVLSGLFSKIILEGFLVIVAWLPAVIAYLTYGSETGGINLLNLILFPYTWDYLLGIYVNVNADVVSMCAVMLFISYVAMLQISYGVVKKMEMPYWMIPLIAFIGLLGLGLGLRNFWVFAFTNFALPLIAIIVTIAFTTALMMFIKVKKTGKGIKITG